VKQCRAVETPTVAPIGRGKPPFQDHDFPAVANASAVVTLGVKVALTRLLLGSGWRIGHCGERSDGSAPRTTLILSMAQSLARTCRERIVPRFIASFSAELRCSFDFSSTTNMLFFWWR
jgi:hypothetical protein